jgi:hypothetical protein
MRLLKTLSCLSLLAASLPAAAQAPFRITSGLLDVSSPIVSVMFSDPIAAAGEHLDITRVHLNGAPNVTITSIEKSLLQGNVLTIRLSAMPPPGNLQICFDRVTYERDGKSFSTSAAMCAAVSGDIAVARDAALKVLTDTPVQPDEKAINASGFVTTASDSTAGGVDLAFNPKLADPNATAFFRLKKATVKGGDPRTFETGAAYRIGIPWNRAQLREISAATDPVKINEILKARQRALIAGSVLNAAVKLEGEPTTFDAVNGVGEADYQILTMTRRLAGSHGYWRAWGLPAGFELGRKLGVDETGSPTEDHEWIARYKAGGGFKIFYDNQSVRFPVRRVEFELHGIWRYLAIEELQFDKEANAINHTTTGGHGYAQTAVKFFFAEVSSRLYGIKASYNRGTLPPAFAPVRSFQFAFVVESNDNNR